MARKLNVRLVGKVALFGVVPLAIAIYVFFVVWRPSHDPKQFYNDAQKYWTAKDYGQAWIAIRNAAKAGGTRDPDIQLLMARIALKQSPPAGGAAVQALHNALAVKPDLVEAQRMIAEVYTGARYWKEAKAEIDRLIQLDPSYGKAYFWDGLVEMGLADAEPIQAKKVPYYEAAAKRLHQAIGKQPPVEPFVLEPWEFVNSGILKRFGLTFHRAPTRLPLYALLVFAHEGLGQDEKVEEALNLAIANDPTQAEAYLMRAGRETAKNKLDQATDVLKKGMEKGADKPRLLVALGEVALKKRDFDAAKDFFTQAVALDPKNEVAHLRLESVYRSENDREKALAAVEAGLVQLPESPALLTEQADLCLELSNFKKAEEVIAHLEKAAPELTAGPVSYLRGKRALMAQQTRQAIAFLEQAKEKQPTPQVRLLLARAYLMADELGAAQSELDSLIADQPTMAGAWRTSAGVQFRLRDFEKAGRSAKVVLETSPDDIEMRLLLAQTLVARQRLAEALKEAQAAAERSKDDPNPYLVMAEIQQQLNKLPDAEASYRRAVAAGGNDFLRVYSLFKRFLTATKQQAKLDALNAEINKVLPPDEAMAITGTVEGLEKQLVERAANGTATLTELLQLGRLYQLTDRLDLARTTFEKVLAKAKPNSSEWRSAWQQVFHLQLAASAYDKAADLVDQLKKVDPEAPELLLTGPLTLLSQKKLPEATEKLRAVAQSHKSMSQAHFLLGQVLARQRKWDEAVVALTRALELRPNLVMARLLLGHIQLGLGNNAAALNEAAESLKYDARLVPALEIRASAYTGLGQWDGAIGAREEIAKIVPDNVVNLIALAGLYRQRRTPEKAEEFFVKAYKLAPDNALLVRAYADFLADTSRARQGEAIVDEYVGRHKDEANAYVVRGEFTAKAFSPAESEKYFRKAAEMAPADPYPLVFLGEQYARVADWEKAGAAYAQASDRAKDDPLPRKRLAEVYMLQGRLDPAKAAIDAVLKEVPKDATALVIAGRIAGRLERLDDARKYIEQALALDPDYGEAKVRLAELCAGPDPLRALEILSTVDPTDGAFEKAMLLRSDINTRRVQLREAILDLRRLLDFRPTSFAGRMSLAARYITAQEHGRAAEILAQLSKERLDKDAGILISLGDAYSRQEHWAEALAAYEKARVVSPTSAEALVGEARSLVALKRPKEAEKRIYQVMNQYEKEPWPRLALVAYYEKMGELDKAFEALRNGLLANDTWEAGYVNLADLLLRANRTEEARGILRTGLAKVPASIPMRASLAAVDISSGHPEAAVETLQPLAKQFESKYSQQPERIDQLRAYMGSVRLYALALYNTGKMDEALKWGMKLWDIDPTDVANANNMAWLLATEKKDYVRAREMIDRCKRLVPNHPQVLDTSGWIYFLENRLGDATDDLLASVKNGENPEARYHLGRVYEARQRPDEARVEYQKALDIGLKGKEKEDAAKRLKQVASMQK
jgi:tetratricopeptide (TPR) repeat protein